MFCTGNPDTGFHCCKLGGDDCVHLLDTPEKLTAKAEEVIDRLRVKGNRRGQIRNLTSGITYACGVAVDVLADYWDANSEIPDRPTFDSLWSAEFEVDGAAESVGDYWEQALGESRNWCVVYGPGERKCCFSTGDSQTDTDIPVEVRALRQAGGD